MKLYLITFKVISKSINLKRDYKNIGDLYFVKIATIDLESAVNIFKTAVINGKIEILEVKFIENC